MIYCINCKYWTEWHGCKAHPKPDTHDYLYVYRSDGERCCDINTNNDCVKFKPAFFLVRWWRKCEY